MIKIDKHHGIVMPLDRHNVDTDAIIPKQFLKSIKRSGFGHNLFDEWRYHDHGEPGMDPASRKKNPDFVLNQPRYEGASILLGRHNFGCGSSREHAVWALIDHGFRVVIAPSFADIFYNNARKNGLLCIVLDEDLVDLLFREVTQNPGYRILVDLPTQQIVLPNRHTIAFDIDPFHKECHIRGLDDIGLTLEHATEIRAFEEKRRQTAPWLFNN
ncbi:MAG: 3-isopropylmalate dehydratase small subunit [Gammaproteobacteria bacterium]|jgi:3-isopropylmalate/(R)-2-methylmalate dehydratase small subunit|nr:3-isopropylmalate dehydratase small subunit [Gammaproteobacteria bacterium]